MNPIKPNLSLLVKLGSIVVHVEEMLSETGHHFDISVIKTALADPEIKAWIVQMNELALLPLKRGLVKK